MNFDWDRNWWVIIILAVFAAPLIQAIFAPWTRYLRYRERRDAIEALKVYAAQGREPPPEVLAALGGRWTRWRGAAEAAANAATGAAAPTTDDRWTRRAERRQLRAEFRFAHEPLRRWNWAIFAGAVTVGFGYAWQHAHRDNDAFLIVAIIAGALTVAGVLSALLATFWRID
ncbi:MAG: hypothetical protein ACHP7N_13590 [Caulobacterales bacterium]